MESVISSTPGSTRTRAPLTSISIIPQGFAGAALAALAAGVLLGLFMLGLPWWAGLVIGAVILLTATAGDLAESAASRESCTQPAGAPPYGSPSLALVCPAGNRTWASFRGLFGDAWLSCSLSAPATLSEADLLDRAGRWCVAVAEAAAVMPTTTGG